MGKRESKEKKSRVGRQTGKKVGRKEGIYASADDWQCPTDIDPDFLRLMYSHTCQGIQDIKSHITSYQGIGKDAVL